MGFVSRIGQSLSRLRVIARAVRGVGLSATLQLARRQVAAGFGQGPDTIYRIKVPGYPQPVSIRGGNSTDGFAFYQHLAMKDLDVLDLGSPRLIIDAGANIGMASLFLLNRYPTVRIVAVEPDPATFNLCRTNLAPFSDRVVFVQGAVWSNCGHIVFVREEMEWNSHVRDTENIHAERNAQPNAGSEVREVKVDSFDIPSLISLGGGGPVDLLKMDIEGSEAEVFSKGTDKWLPAIRNIVIELHGPECEKSFRGAMEGYRYEGFDLRSVMVCRNLLARVPS
jgi:FkbM family methyltransferase